MHRQVCVFGIVPNRFPVQRNMTYWFISLFSIIVASLVVTSLT